MEQTVLEIKYSISKRDRYHHYPVIRTLLLHDTDVSRGYRIEEKPKETKDGKEVKPNTVISRKGTKKIVSNISHYMLSLEK